MLGSGWGNDIHGQHSESTAVRIEALRATHSIAIRGHIHSNKFHSFACHVNFGGHLSGTIGASVDREEQLVVSPLLARSLAIL